MNSMHIVYEEHVFIWLFQDNSKWNLSILLAVNAIPSLQNRRCLGIQLDLLHSTPCCIFMVLHGAVAVTCASQHFPRESPTQCEKEHASGFASSRECEQDSTSFSSLTTIQDSTTIPRGPVMS